MAVVMLPATSSAIASNPQTTEQAGGRVDAIFADLQKPGSPACPLRVLPNGHIIQPEIQDDSRRGNPKGGAPD
jgi:hypothetical protein